MPPSTSNSDYVVITQIEKLSDQSVVYFAYHPELPGCMSDGETADEARAHLADAREVYLSHLRESGLPIPNPTPLFGGAIPVQTLDELDGSEKTPCGPMAEFVLA